MSLPDYTNTASILSKLDRIDARTERMAMELATVVQIVERDEARIATNRDWMAHFAQLQQQTAQALSAAVAAPTHSKDRRITLFHVTLVIGTITATILVLRFFGKV